MNRSPFPFSRKSFLAACILWLLPLIAASEGKSYTLAFLPDTKNMVLHNPPIWFSICQWIVDNKERYDIEAVLSLGDMTNKASVEEYEAVSRGFAQIERAGIVVLPLLGDHDYVGSMKVDRQASRFNAYFGPGRFEGKAWYGGNLEGSNANYFAVVGPGERKTLICALETFPSKKAAEYCSTVIDAHPETDVIVITHGYLKPDGSRMGSGYEWGPAYFDFATMEEALDGEALWNGMIRTKKNIRAVLCGHLSMYPYANHSAAKGDRGNEVQQVIADFQSVRNFGDGLIGLMRIDGEMGIAEVSYYCTYAPSGQGRSPEYASFSFPW